MSNMILCPVCGLMADAELHACGGPRQELVDYRAMWEAAELRAALLEAQLEQALDGNSLVTQLADEHARLLASEDRLEQARAVMEKALFAPDAWPFRLLREWLAAHPAPAAGGQGETGE